MIRICVIVIVAFGLTHVTKGEADAADHQKNGRSGIAALSRLLDL